MPTKGGRVGSKKGFSHSGVRRCHLWPISGKKTPCGERQMQRDKTKRKNQMRMKNA